MGKQSQTSSGHLKAFRRKMALHNTVAELHKLNWSKTEKIPLGHAQRSTSVHHCVSHDIQNFET
uniref:Uncharacterized protein n=1 Tax=Rhizophora mucronata TaxID=61149 RepID=A0A2P2M975_RHIMU